MEAVLDGRWQSDRRRVFIGFLRSKNKVRWSVIRDPSTKNSRGWA